MPSHKLHLKWAIKFGINPKIADAINKKIDSGFSDILQATMPWVCKHDFKNIFRSKAVRDILIKEIYLEYGEDGVKAMILHYVMDAMRDFIRDTLKSLIRIAIEEENLPSYKEEILNYLKSNYKTFCQRYLDRMEKWLNNNKWIFDMMKEYGLLLKFRDHFWDITWDILGEDISVENLMERVKVEIRKDKEEMDEYKKLENEIKDVLLMAKSYANWKIIEDALNSNDLRLIKMVLGRISIESKFPTWLRDKARSLKEILKITRSLTK